MKNLKDSKILILALMVAIGLGFEGLRRLNFPNSNAQNAELNKAGELFAVSRERVHNVEKKALRSPRATQIQQIQKVHSAQGVKFDLKAAIADYQKEHGLEITKDGKLKVKKGQLKDAKNKKKKKSKYEYVYDTKRGRWVKRLKLSDEQKEELLAKKQAEMLEKMKELKAQKNSGTADAGAEGSSEWAYTTKKNADTQTQNSPHTEETNTPKNYEYWASLLLQTPNASGLQEFMTSYKSGAVSAEIFTKISQALLDDPRSEMKEEALSLADSFPSVGSFKILVQALADASASSSVTEKASSIMDSDYTTISGLTVLSRVLKQKDEQLLLAATQQLNLTVQKVLAEGGDKSAYASDFSPFVSLLQDLTGSTGEVATQAGQLLALLQSSFQLQNVAANTENGGI
jgi:hypothetical protein